MEGSGHEPSLSWAKESGLDPMSIWESIKEIDWVRLCFRRSMKPVNLSGLYGVRDRGSIGK